MARSAVKSQWYQLLRGFDEGQERRMRATRGGISSADMIDDRCRGTVGRKRRQEQGSRPREQRRSAFLFKAYSILE